MLKKYIYIGVLMGAIFLAGCSEHAEEPVLKREEISTEKVNNGQAVEVETFSDRDIKEVVSVTPLDLTKEQKEDYYKQYEEIVRKVNSEYNEDLELGPLEKFKPEEWVTPEYFEQIATDMATMEFTSKVFGGDPVE